MRAASAQSSRGAEYLAERARALDPSVGATTLDNARRLREQVERAVRDGSPLPHRLERIAVELTHYQTVDREHDAQAAREEAEREAAFAAFAADVDEIADSLDGDEDGERWERELEAEIADDAARAIAREDWTAAIQTEHYAEGGAPFVAAQVELDETDAREEADWIRHSAAARRTVQRARRKAQRAEAARERERRKAERAERKARRAAERERRKAEREAKREAKRAERERDYQAQAARMRERARELTVPADAPELTVPADAPELAVPADDPAGEDFQRWEARVADAERAFMLEAAAIVAGREPDNEPTEDQSNVITLETKPNRNGNRTAPETVTTPAQVEPAREGGADIYAPVIADLERQRDEIGDTLARLRAHRAAHLARD